VRNDPARFGYSIGLGRRCRVVSEANAWVLAPGIEDARVVRNWGGTQFSDRGSILNGAPVDLAAAFRRAYPAVQLDTQPASSRRQWPGACRRRMSRHWCARGRERSPKSCFAARARGGWRW
jgi:hypothetical protein